MIWEQVYGPAPGSEEMAGGNVIVNAHMYGAIAGGLLCAAMLTADRLFSDQHADQPRDA